MITILTPTYNRAYTLTTAYNSLIKQTNNNFEWLIIDDGSTDNTNSLVNSFIKENKIKIRYFKKKNGGKHTALNYGIKKITNPYILILDSDDYLKEDCIDIVLSSIKKYETNKKIACLTFLKVYPNNLVVSKPYKEKEIISNHIDFRYNKNHLGDMCEVFKTSILKKYPFPVFSNEKFLSETIIWNKIALYYDTVYINKPIYVCDYLEDGLTTNSLKLRYNNPIGTTNNANIFLNKRFKLSIRMKNAIIYDAFSLISKQSLINTIKQSNNKLLSILYLPLGIILYIYLKLKYKK